MDLVIEYIKTKPFGASDKVTLTCNMDNIHALNLYRNKGFKETGAMDEDEIYIWQSNKLGILKQMEAYKGFHLFLLYARAIHIAISGQRIIQQGII